MLLYHVATIALPGVGVTSVGFSVKESQNASFQPDLRKLEVCRSCGGDADAGWSTFVMPLAANVLWCFMPQARPPGGQDVD